MFSCTEREHTEHIFPLSAGESVATHQNTKLARLMEKPVCVLKKAKFSVESSECRCQREDNLEQAGLREPAVCGC